MADITVTIHCRVRGLWVARVLGRLPDPVGRWARCRIRAKGAIGRGPWEEIGRWEEPA